ncbi:Alpha/Beta hydrolase protein [Flagelloscypha sp. PMI_526]|nr:Alpha/Beta hydrolase protein [Flagelloscypha sp. PMI_526]
MNTSSLVLPTGIQLTYYDSGLTHRVQNNKETCFTLFALHGLAFNALIWKYIFPIAAKQNIRFISINRRGYGGSSPLTRDEAALLSSNGPKFLDDRAQELLNFIHLFFQQENASHIEGGFGILGWSLGAISSIAAVANVQNASEAVQQTFARGFRSLTLHEPPSQAIGMRLDPSRDPTFYMPLTDTFIPASEQLSFFTVWVTSYFQHNHSRTPHSSKNLINAAPSSSHVPTIYHIPPSVMPDLFLQNGGVSNDLDAWMNVPVDVLKENYEKAKAWKDGDTNVNVHLVVGEMSPADHVWGGWKVEEEEKGEVSVKWIAGGNHFSHWDASEDTWTHILKECKT